MFKNLNKYRDAGLLLLRLGIGAVFIFVHGIPKLSGGAETWHATGQAMSVVGINFGFTIWGLLAALTETLGGVLLIIGFVFRPVLVLMLILMLIATFMQLTAGEPMGPVVSHPLKMAILFFCWMLIGPGKYSIDGK